MKIITRSKLQTQKLSRELAQKIIRAKKINKTALIVALKGDLGAGKTTFAQGFLRGLGVKSKITSPTFVLIKTYNLQPATYNKKFEKASHVDCYRIKNVREIIDLDFKKIISNSQNIVLIEWPEHISKILPKKRINIFFEHGKKENEREIIYFLLNY